MIVHRNSLQFQAKNEWRSWLEKNHAIEKEAWLRVRKSRSTESGVSYEEAVEEALCFGWIDGVMNSLDDKAYLLRFSPRKSGSIWAVSNLRRVERLIEQGRMTEAGFAKVREAKESGEWDEAVRREDVSRVPDDLLEALAKNPLACANFETLPDSYKKQLFYWIESPKLAETRRRRIEKTVAALGEGKRPWG